MLGTVVVGVIFVDIKGFPEGAYAPKSRNLGRVEFVHGGVSRNIAQDIAVSGMPVTFISMTEKSALGREVVEHLSECGVNTEFILPCKRNGIGKWLVVLDTEGDVAGQISSPPDMAPLARFVESYGEDFVKDAENVILEMDIGEEITERVLSLAEKHNKNVYAIIGNMSVILRRPDFIRRTDCFICNEIEMGRILQQELSTLSPEELLPLLDAEAASRGFPSVVVTMGERGCVFCDRHTGERGVIPAIPTDVVDTSGAGDAFLAGTVMGLTRGLCLREAAERGTQLASLTIRSTESSCPAGAFLSETDAPATAKKKIKKTIAF